jgi:hypothetical protein
VLSGEVDVLVDELGVLANDLPGHGGDQGGHNQDSNPRISQDHALAAVVVFFAVGFFCACFT